VYGDNSITKGYLTQNLAALCASAGNNKMAMLYYSQAESIMRQYLEEDNSDLLSCQSQQRDLNNKLITTDEISLLPVPELLSADMQIA